MKKGMTRRGLPRVLLIRVRIEIHKREAGARLLSKQEG